MLAFRTTWYVKPGMMEKAVEVLWAEMSRGLAAMEAAGIKVEGEGRIYSPLYSPHVLIMETNFESMEASAKFWENYDSDSAASKEFWAKWFTLVERHGPSEVWNLKKK